MTESGFIGANTPMMQELFQAYVTQYGVINNDIITNILQLTTAFTEGIEEYKGDCEKIQGMISTTNGELKKAASGIEGNWFGQQKDDFTRESAELDDAMQKLATAFTEFRAYFEKIRGNLEAVNNELNAAVKKAGECTDVLANDVDTFKQNLGIIDA